MHKMFSEGDRLMLQAVLFSAEILSLQSRAVVKCGIALHVIWMDKLLLSSSLFTIITFVCRDFLYASVTTLLQLVGVG